METYYLITNTSGMKYWSRYVNKYNATEQQARLVARHGCIYENDKGGYFTPNCVREVHKIVIAKNFPQTS